MAASTRPPSPNHYLIIAPAWVGDMVMAQSLFRLLKQREPACQIDVLAPPASLPMARFMPEVTHHYEFALKHGEFGWRKRRAWGRWLKTRQYSVAVVLPNSWKSALVPFFARIRRRRGFIGESRYVLLNDRRRLDKTALPRMIDRFCALALPPGETLPETLPFPRFQVSAEAHQTLRDKLALAGNAPVAGFCPGAEYGPAKKWPVASYAALATALRQRGYAVWLFGGANDSDTTAGICQQSGDVAQGPPIVDLAGKTSLTDAVTLMAGCDYVVSNDTGLMHIANALGCKTLVIYGSSSDRFTPPLNTRALSACLTDLPCRPCFKRECPLGHMNCLNKLGVEAVLERFTALEQL